MADWEWRFSLPFTARAIFSRGGQSVFRRWAWGDFSVLKASRSWQARSNMSGYPSPRFGPWLEFCGEGPTGNPPLKVTRQKHEQDPKQRNNFGIPSGTKGGKACRPVSG